MNRDTALELIDELLALTAAGSAFLDEAVTTNPVAHYTCPDHFAIERERVFGAAPSAVAHASELPGPGSFLRCEIAGKPILLTRDKSGRAHAFLNVCRHRGTRLVDEMAGCKHRFSCPYHAWTYANTGALIAAPHFEVGFAELDKSDLGLARLDCQEKFGFVWVVPTPGSDFGSYFSGLEPDLEALALDQMVIAQSETAVRNANWKILVEGGIEAYHFKVAHRDTIGPFFEDNLSSYRSFGPHLRSILPRTSMASLSEVTRNDWRLRDHANVLYSLFPTTQLLVQQDHIVWVSQTPLATDRTRVRVATLAPADAAADDAHWKRNHAITTRTLEEDFAIGESIQAGAASGANDHMTFGRFEGALGQFNRSVEARLGGGG